MSQLGANILSRLLALIWLCENLPVRDQPGKLRQNIIGWGFWWPIRLSINRVSFGTCVGASISLIRIWTRQLCKELSGARAHFYYTSLPAWIRKAQYPETDALREMAKSLQIHMLRWICWSLPQPMLAAVNTGGFGNTAAQLALLEEDFISISVPTLQKYNWYSEANRIFVGMCFKTFILANLGSENINNNNILISCLKFLKRKRKYRKTKVWRWKWNINPNKKQ